jgi:PucR family transcriptional regulator, purine catabolism regulatory protein
MSRTSTNQRPESSAVPLTVRGLTEIPYLETRLHAGAGGAERVITWAHAIEVPHPWEWLEAGDLLMTVGLGLPSDPAEQTAYVENLSDVGVCGIALGDGFPLPPLAPAMIDAAERRAMPILYIGWDTPFAQISRAVAAANYGPQLGRLVKAIRVYDLVRASVAARSRPLELLRAVEKEIDCRVFVFVSASDSGRAAFGEENEPPTEVRDVFLDALDEHEGKLPSFLRLAAGGETLLVVPIPTQRTAHLLVLPGAEVPPFALLQHVATVAALELERMWSAREERRRLGSETLAQLMEGRLIQGTAGALKRLGFEEGGPLVMLAMAEGDGQSIGDLHNLLADAGIPNQLLRRDGVLYALLVDEEDATSRIAELLPPGTRAGASEAFDDPTNAPTASQQAKWALGAATAERPIAHHGKVSSLFGPRSPAEAQMTVAQVLGPIVEYDAEHGTELLHSLRVFLQNNRSWKRSTDELFVHKQTLVYRMRRIEELTGRRLNDTSDVAELWLALRAEETVA